MIGHALQLPASVGAAWAQQSLVVNGNFDKSSNRLKSVGVTPARSNILRSAGTF
jgi:hypothetical protein